MGTRADSASRSTVGAEFYSLLDAVDGESIADEFEIGTYITKHDFDNYLKTPVFEGLIRLIHLQNSLRKLLSTTN